MQDTSWEPLGVGNHSLSVFYCLCLSLCRWRRKFKVGQENMDKLVPTGRHELHSHPLSCPYKSFAKDGSIAITMYFSLSPSCSATRVEEQRHGSPQKDFSSHVPQLQAHTSDCQDLSSRLLCYFRVRYLSPISLGFFVCANRICYVIFGEKHTAEMSLYSLHKLPRKRQEKYHYCCEV